jgi:cytidine deaminase
MIAFGERSPAWVAVAAAGEQDCLPCGLCLQALAEFGDPAIVARQGGRVHVVLLSDLLTAPFVGRGGPPGVPDDGAALETNV